jgi:hypothetical protein
MRGSHTIAGQKNRWSPDSLRSHLPTRSDLIWVFCEIYPVLLSWLTRIKSEWKSICIWVIHLKFIPCFIIPNHSDRIWVKVDLYLSDSSEIYPVFSHFKSLGSIWVKVDLYLSDSSEIYPVFSHSKSLGSIWVKVDLYLSEIFFDLSERNCWFFLGHCWFFLVQTTSIQ